MRLPGSVFKLIVAALAVLTSATATPAIDESQDAVAIVNNTSTPAAGKDKPEAWLSVDCGGGFQSVKKDTTLRISCTVAADEALSVTYNVVGHNSTAIVDCGGTERPDFIDDSQVTLTFTGSGASVVFTQSCTGLG